MIGHAIARKFRSVHCLVNRTCDRRAELSATLANRVPAQAHRTLIKSERICTTTSPPPCCTVSGYCRLRGSGPAETKAPVTRLIADHVFVGRLTAQLRRNDLYIPGLKAAPATAKFPQPNTRNRQSLAFAKSRHACTLISPNHFGL